MLVAHAHNQAINEDIIQVVFGSNGFTENSSPINVELKLLQHNISISNIKREILDVFKAESKTQKVVKKKGKHLKSNRLHRVAVKDSRVFEKKTVNSKAKFDVTLILDRSGSMRPHIEEASAVAASLLDGLEHAKNCSFAFLTFPLDLSAYHQRGSNLNLDAITSITANGGSRIIDAVSEAGCELAKSRNKKVIICITDMNIDRRYSEQLNDLIKSNPSINYIWIGLNTKFQYNINGTVIDDVRIEYLADAVKSLKHKLVA